MYWKQTRTKLYKGLTRALEEYISTHLETVCGKLGRAREYAELAAAELSERKWPGIKYVERALTTGLTKLDTALLIVY